MQHKKCNHTDEIYKSTLEVISYVAQAYFLLTQDLLLLT